MRRAAAMPAGTGTQQPFERIDVLRGGGGASAVYGLRGTNGVILIRTRTRP